MSTEFNIRKGDMFSFLTSSDLDGGMQVVLHSCNAQGVMGAGFAATVKSRFPECYQTYVNELALNTDPIKRLGTFSIYHNQSARNEFFIVNIIGQLYYGKTPGFRYTSYDAIDTALKNIDEMFFIDVPVNFHFPKIGSVRGGGSWDVVSQIIKHRLNRNQYTLNLWEIN